MPSEELERRDVLKMLATGAISCCLGLGCSRSVPLEQDVCFPQSVASGDPHARSVILWTRVIDPQIKNDDYPVQLEVARDAAFAETFFRQTYRAEAALDHCLCIRIDDLSPSTYYYYRFTYAGVRSRVGRTRTLPDPSAAEAVLLAVVYGQDYIGRYYNAYQHLLRHHDPDVILHLGDYIYETTGDPTFQVLRPSRTVRFHDQKHAKRIEWNGVTFYAANSLENYRQLYRTYRADPVLQQLHERHPMIAIWDDHEYRDDYAGGGSGEEHSARREHARRAYLEYMPLEIGLEDTPVWKGDNPLLSDPDKGLILYRDFHLGKRAHLIMSDYRTYRDDTLIPADAFPGSVFADRETMITLLESRFPGEGVSRYEAMAAQCSPYLDLDTQAHARYRTIFKELIYRLYIADGADWVAAGVLTSRYLGGKMNLLVANDLIRYHNEHRSEDQDALPLLYEEEGDETFEAYERGLSYLDLGKITAITRDGIGVSTLVTKGAFDLYAQLCKRQNVFGTTQERWIRERIAQSRSDWLLFASSVSMAPLAVDLSDQELLPALFRKSIYLDLDQYDGFPEARVRVLSAMDGHNALVLSGDVHATFVTDHNGIREITGPAVSSATASEMLRSKIATYPGLEHRDALLAWIDGMDLDGRIRSCTPLCHGVESSAEIRYADTTHHGYTLLRLDEERVDVSLFGIPEEYAQMDLHTQPDQLDRIMMKKCFTFYPVA